jgi:hypothetical protein
MTRISKILIIFLAIAIGVIVYGALREWQEEQREVSSSLFHASFSADSYARQIIDVGAQFAVRTADWTSDNAIRTKTDEILKSAPSIVGAKNLGEYIRNNKLPIDPNVSVADIVLGTGMIISSTKAERIGLNERTLAPLAQQASKDPYGFARIGSVFEDLNSRIIGSEFHIAAPIYAPGTASNPIAVLIIHIPQKVITDKVFLNNDLPATRRVYVLERDGSVIVSPGVSGGDKGLVNQSASPAFRSCKSETPYSGIYTRNDGVKVYAASTCVPEYGFTVIVEDAAR